MNLETVHRAVLLTDLVDSAGLNEALGDLEFSRVMVRLEQVIRSLIRENHGREIDKTDGFLIVFEQPLNALAFALSLHEAVAGLTPRQSMLLRMRTGLHYGTLVLRKNSPEDVAEGAKAVDADGLTKVVAARLTALAEPGQVLITRTLFDLVRQDELAPERVRAEAMWLAHGSYLLQGLNDPVEIFEVGYPGAAPLAPPSDKGKARRAILPQDEYALGWRPANGQAIPTAPEFTVVRKLGEGGYGEVWLAENKQTGERRVFKFCFDPARMRSLNREKLLLTILQENLGDRDDIVRILDWNATEAPYFIALAYIPKDNLLTYLDKRPADQPLAAQTVLKVIRKAAVALEAAHSVGVLHKDIKPSNLLIGGDDDDPDVHLIDFGIGLYNKPDDGGARPDVVVTPGSDHTTLRTSSFSGSRMYIAPEVIEGKPPTVQADLFSLGVLLYQLLRNDRETGLKVGWERDIDDPFLVDLVASATDGDLNKRLRSVSALVSTIDTLEQRRNEASAAEQERQALLNAEQALEVQKRRRRAYATALLFVIPISLISLGFTFHSRRESKRADQKAAEATRAREKGSELIWFMLQDLSKELRRAGQLPLMDSVTSQALNYYSDESTSSLSTQELYIRGKGFCNLGKVFFDRNKMREASDSYTQAFSIAENLLAIQPNNPKFLLLMGASLTGKESSEYRTGKNREITSTAEKELAFYRKAYSVSPDDGEIAKLYADSCFNLGYLYKNTTGTDLINEAYRVSSDSLKLITDPAQLKVREAAVTYSLAWMTTNSLIIKNRLNEAISYLEEASQIVPDNYIVKYSLLESYIYYAGQFRFSEPSAHEQIEKGVDVAEALLEKDYSNVEWRRNAAKCFFLYVDEKKAKGELDEAVKYGNSVARLLDSMIIENSNDVALWEDYWGNRFLIQQTLSMQAKYRQALEATDATNSVMKQVLQQEPNNVRFVTAYTYNMLRSSVIKGSPEEFLESVSMAKNIDSQLILKDRDYTFDIFLRTCDRIAETQEVFKADPLKWNILDSKNSGIVLNYRHHFYVDNPTSEALVIKEYMPGATQPFNVVYAIPGEGVNMGLRLNLSTGISVNGSPIMELKHITGIEPIESSCFADYNQLTLNLREWLELHGDKVRYRIPLETEPKPPAKQQLADI